MDGREKLPGAARVDGEPAVRRAAWRVRLGGQARFSSAPGDFGWLLQHLSSRPKANQQ
jgi:hypothetical protein